MHLNAVNFEKYLLQISWIRKIVKKTNNNLLIVKIPSITVLRHLMEFLYSTVDSRSGYAGYLLHLQ